MAGSRTLKLTILGDVDNLNKSLRAATDDVDTFGDRMSKAGKVIGQALAAAAAAAAAYAVKIGVDGVKAAIADEKAQTQLAIALENATGATKSQVKATEDAILQMSLATGVADDQLRPALGRLVRSTGDITKAQDLLATALDISAATGKPLETVANALGKAYDGNTAALGKLGVGLSSAELKAMSFTDVQSKLSDLFGGAAAANADTYSGKIARVQIAFNEAKETLGYALLPILQKVIDFINKNALPVIKAFADGFSMDGEGLGGVITTWVNIIKNLFTPIINGMISAFKSVKGAIGDNLDTFKEFAGYIGTYLAPVIGTVLGGAISIVGKIAGGVVNVIAGIIKVINTLVSGAIDGINAIIKAYNAIPILPNIPTINKPTISTPSVSIPPTDLPTTPTIPNVGGGTGTGSGGGVTTAATAAAAAVNSGLGLNTVSIAGAQSVNPNNPFKSEVYNITVNGAIDSESTARQIVDVLNQSSYRGTLGSDAFTTVRSGAI